MASSVCFAVPFVRQLWWWLGLRPVSRQLMAGLLAAGKAVVLNPGGIQECMGMQHGSETVFLRKRHGFVRLAIQQGAPL
ncbi:diacylglycerol acyltransferase, partial [Haematococcus lacustris]